MRETACFKGDATCGKLGTKKFCSLSLIFVLRKARAVATAEQDPRLAALEKMHVSDALGYLITSACYMEQRARTRIKEILQQTALPLCIALASL